MQLKLTAYVCAFKFKELIETLVAFSLSTYVCNTSMTGTLVANALGLTVKVEWVLSLASIGVASSTPLKNHKYVGRHYHLVWTVCVDLSDLKDERADTLCQVFERTAHILGIYGPVSLVPDWSRKDH